MVQVAVGLALVMSLPAMTWWYWWRAVYRRPLGQKLEQLRVNVGLMKLALGMFVVLAAMQGVTAATDGDSGAWWAMVVLLGAIVLSVPPMVLMRRLLDDSRPGPSADLDRRVTRLRRWTVPASVGVGLLPGLSLIGGEVSLARVLVGCAAMALFMFAVLTTMRVAIERSVRAPR